MKFFKCVNCKEEKSETNFYKDKSKPSGYKPRCKPCDALSVNKERRKSYFAAYKANNLERFRAASLASYHKYKERYAEVRSQYRTSVEYKKSHRKHSLDARARRFGVFIESIDPYQFFESSSKNCTYCQCRLDESNFQIDHIIPISKGGKHDAGNVCICCQKCNVSKSNKLDWEVPHQIL